MNKEKIYILSIILLMISHVLLLGICSNKIDKSNLDGWFGGVKTTIKLIMEEIDRDGFIILVHPETREEMTLLDFNYSMDICLNATKEALFNE